MGDGRAPVFLTGATGFIGSHVLDALLDAGYPVRALVRGEPGRLGSRPGVTPVSGDLARPGALTRELDGCRYLVHVAAHYSFAPRDAEVIRRVNVAGTTGLLEAARIAGVERAVVTSSSGVVGPARNGRPATEEDFAPPHRSAGAGLGYHDSKVEEEWAVWRRGCRRSRFCRRLRSDPETRGLRRPGRWCWTRSAGEWWSACGEA